jgi:15-cis-phytoene synthase
MIRTKHRAPRRRRWANGAKATAAGSSDDDVLNAIVVMFARHQIPVEDGEAFLKSMFMDEEKFSYANYAELEEYMYGSAGVIGLMVTRCVGYSTPDAFPYAVKLGYAFQLTNFLRDIREDCDELGRVYMPEDELGRFRLRKRDVERGVYDERFVDFMKFQIERNRRIYREALPGIKLLHWRGRLAVRVSYVLYKAILAEVERVNYNVFKGRVRTNLRQKIWLSAKALVGVYE